jgi:hypothetical protein
MFRGSIYLYIDVAWFYAFFSARFIKPDGCCCLIQFMFGVLIFIYFFCLFVCNRTKLEDTTSPTTHGDWSLYVQNWEAPDDGRKSARNM